MSDETPQVRVIVPSFEATDPPTSPLWRLEDGRWLTLLTPSQLGGLPQGTRVVDLFGTTHRVGWDELDDDIRYGYTAYGLEQ